MPYGITDMVLYFFLYSFLGWAQETVQCSIREKRFVNRGFLNGPLCPIYGCGALLIFTCLLPIKRGIASPWLSVPLVFLCGAVIASALEYVTSWAMEKLFHARWWDYSDKKWNINGRICFWISVGWGLLAAIFVFGIQPLFEKGMRDLAAWQPLLPVILAMFFSAVMLVDTVFSVKAALSISNRLEKLENLGGLLKEHLENLELPTEDVVLRLESAYDRLAGKKQGVQNSIQSRLNVWRALSADEKKAHIAGLVAELQKKREDLFHSRFQQRRLLRAFPHMRRTDAQTDAGKTRTFNELLDEWRNHLKKK